MQNGRSLLNIQSFESTQNLRLNVKMIFFYLCSFHFFFAEDIRCKHSCPISRIVEWVKWISFSHLISSEGSLILPSQLPMVQFFNHLQSSKTKRCGTPYSPAHSNPQSRLHTDQGVTLNPRVLKGKAMRGYGRVIASKKKTCEIQDKEGKTSIPWEVCVWLGQRTSNLAKRHRICSIHVSYVLYFHDIHAKVWNWRSSWSSSDVTEHGSYRCRFPKSKTDPEGSLISYRL